MTGRERARRIIGLGQPQYPKQYDFPETTEELNRVTGAVWRPLPYRPRLVRSYFPYDPDDMESYEATWGDVVIYQELGIPDPLWEQAWALRHDGWLVIYAIVAFPDEQLRGAYIDTLAHPELDRESAERIAMYWWRLVELPGEPLIFETNTPELPYLLQFRWPQLNASMFQMDRDERIVAGQVEHPDFLPASLRLMRAIAQRLREVS